MSEESNFDGEKIVIEKDGKKIECDILFTFDCKDTEKVYIGYTDNSFDKNGRKTIYVASYDPVIGPGTLEEIRTKEEMDMINDVLEKIDRES